MRTGGVLLLALVLSVPCRGQTPPPVAPEAPGGYPHLSGVEPAPAEILELGPEIRRFLDANIGLNASREARYLKLQTLVFGKHGLEITYGDSDTRTASQTFEARSGNCLSFTLLFVAMARYLGLPAYFLEVDEVLSWDHRNDIVLNNRHMFAEVELYNGFRRVDFLPGVDKSYRRVERIDTTRALAHFYNNRGAELLAAGEVEPARRYFEQAIELDPTFPSAWVNRGVAQRRAGDPQLAETSYLHALELDPLELTAASNLGALYLSLGRNEEAKPFLERADQYNRRNPFFFFRRAVRAKSVGKLVEASDELRKAIRRMPEEPLFHATLAEVLVARGELRKARQSLEQAIRLSSDFDQLDRLRRQLADLDRGR
ncbi:MAG: tetratricopeptide repeat protein [Acidobacteria bacterium]|nr:tetratricopeptide repeat protein [Acidobacteriota bacterium]